MRRHEISFGKVRCCQWGFSESASCQGQRQDMMSNLQQIPFCLFIYLSIHLEYQTTLTLNQKTIMVVSVQSTLCLLVYCKQNARQFWEYSLTRAPSWGWNFGRPNLPTDAYCILMMISWNIIIHQNNTNWGVHKIYCSLRSSLMLHILLKQTVQNSPSQLSARTTCMFL